MFRQPFCIKCSEALVNDNDTVTCRKCQFIAGVKADYILRTRRADEHNDIVADLLTGVAS